MYEATITFVTVLIIGVAVAASYQYMRNQIDQLKKTAAHYKLLYSKYFLISYGVIQEDEEKYCHQGAGTRINRTIGDAIKREITNKTTG